MLVCTTALPAGAHSIQRGDGCALLVIGIPKEPARRRRKTKDAEVVTGNESSHDRLGYRLRSGAVTVMGRQA